MAIEDEVANRTTVVVESPNVAIDAPIGISIIDGVQDRLTDIVDKIKSGDDEVMTTLFLGTAFIVVGVFVWRRL